MGSPRPSRVLILGIILASIHSGAPIVAQNAVSLLTLDNAALPANLAIGAATTIEVTGDPFAPFALATSEHTANVPTIWGTIGLDIFDPSFSILIDAFNPANPNAGYGVLDSGGLRAFTFVPFSAGAVYGQSLFFQTIALSPLNPFGLCLSNTLEIHASPCAPVVTSIQPNVLTPGQVGHIFGLSLGGAATQGSPPIVQIGDVQATVLSHADLAIDFIVPANAHSGSLSVTTPSGISDTSGDTITSFVAIIASPIDEATAEAAPNGSPVAIYGAIDFPSDVDLYEINLQSGDEVFVDLLPLDMSDFTVFAYNALNYGVAIDPVIDVVMPSLVLDSLAHDDNSGPGFGASFGWNGAPRFVVPVSGTYTFRVSSAFAFTTGCYLLSVRSRVPAIPPSPRILALIPNNGQPGNAVEAVAIGVDLQNPQAAAIAFAVAGGYQTVTPTLGVHGLLSWNVPAGAVTGHVRVINQFGVMSPIDADDPSSSFLVWRTTDVEDPQPSAQIISPNTTYLGVIANTWEADTFQVALNAGDHVTLRVCPYDLSSNRILRGALFSPTILDPEVVVTTLYSSVALTNDAHSGPGYSAEIGGIARAAWTVPITDNYIVTVRPWFFLSAGTYVFDIGVN